MLNEDANINRVRPTSAAVSVRKVQGPSEIGTNPDSCSKVTSEAVIPPSGPTKSLAACLGWLPNTSLLGSEFAWRASHAKKLGRLLCS